jgi:hypothetical protein
MRRTATTLLAAVLALALPAAALAGAGHRTDRGARRGSARTHVKKFWSHDPGHGQQSAGGSKQPTPAGVVASYEGQTLTIQLANGSLVSGAVTPVTRLICVPAPEAVETPEGTETPEGAEAPNKGAPGSPSYRPRTAHGDYRRYGGYASGGNHYGRGRHGHRWDRHGYPGGPQPCETSSLTVGTTVLAAQLGVGSEGATWEGVILQPAS